LTTVGFRIAFGVYDKDDGYAEGLSVIYPTIVKMALYQESSGQMLALSEATQQLRRQVKAICRDAQL
jgi:hypothetical protein